MSINEPWRIYSRLFTLTFIHPLILEVQSKWHHVQTFVYDFFVLKDIMYKYLFMTFLSQNTFFFQIHDCFLLENWLAFMLLKYMTTCIHQNTSNPVNHVQYFFYFFYTCTCNFYDHFICFYNMMSFGEKRAYDYGRSNIYCAQCFLRSVFSIRVYS